MQKLSSVLKKEEKLRVMRVKRMFLRMISPIFPALGLVRDGIGQMPGGCQVVWMHESFGGHQRVIQRLDL